MTEKIRVGFGTMLGGLLIASALNPNPEYIEIESFAERKKRKKEEKDGN